MAPLFGGADHLTERIDQSRQFVVSIGATGIEQLVQSIDRCGVCGFAGDRFEGGISHVSDG